MARYSGYVDVPHSSYAEWKNNTLNNGYDIDGFYGCQCWDFVSIFWRNLGFPSGYPLIFASAAYTMWNNRYQNASYNGVTYFDLITDVYQIKQGDIIVFNYFPANQYGHVGFADVDYANWTPDPLEPNEFPILSENNGGIPDPAGGSYVNVHGYDITLFLGAFRYKAWETGPTPPSVSRKPQPHHFNWAVFGRKIRQRNMGL